MYIACSVSRGDKKSRWVVSRINNKWDPGEKRRDKKAGRQRAGCGRVKERVGSHLFLCQSLLIYCFLLSSPID